MTVIMDMHFACLKGDMGFVWLCCISCQLWLILIHSLHHDIWGGLMMYLAVLDCCISWGICFYRCDIGIGGGGFFFL